MSHHPTRSSEIYRRIDELSSLASKDPAQVQKVLPAALEELKICLEEPPLADEERKREEEALREADARFRTAQENSLYGFRNSPEHSGRRGQDRRLRLDIEDLLPDPEVTNASLSGMVPTIPHHSRKGSSVNICTVVLYQSGRA